MNTVTFIGYLASVVSIISFLPQAIKSWRTKATKDISLPGYILLESGAVLWLMYGIMMKDVPIIITNSTIGAIVLCTIFLKLKHG